MAAVRPEFRAPVLAIEPEDLVFGSGPCLVDSCKRAARLHGMCNAHHQRWNAEGRPDKEKFAASTAAQIRRYGTMPSCSVTGCGYGRNSTGLCIAHVRQWHRADRPDLDAWLSTCSPVTTPAPHGQCRVVSCELWATARIPLCVSHAQRWRKAGRPDAEAFAVAHEQTPHHSETIDLLRLPPRLTSWCVIAGGACQAGSWSVFRRWLCGRRRGRRWPGRCRAAGRGGESSA